MGCFNMRHPGTSSTLRSLGVLLFLGLVLVGMAQRDGSLTPEFASLSARQRARIAAQEEVDALADTVFQRRMSEADRLFQQKRFEDALSAYREARSLRPYNVHPKVKVQDLEALIARRAQEAGPSPPASSAADPPPRSPAPLRPLPSIPPVTGSTRTGQLHAETPEQDWSERTFKEGRAVVHERLLAEEGHVEVWRKVLHPWGEVVYFKDGKAVSGHQWVERFRP